MDLAIAVRLPLHSRRRAISAGLVFLLHALLLLALLHALTAPVRRIAPAREMILRLLPHLEHTQQQPSQQKAAPAAMPRARVIPDVPPPPSTMPAPTLSGLGQNLFGCAPENLGSLTPEQRSHCIIGLARPGDTHVSQPPSQVKDPRRRAAEMAAKNRPGKIPCSYMTNAPGPYGSVTPVPMISFDCLRDGIFGDGFKPLNGLEH